MPTLVAPAPLLDIDQLAARWGVTPRWVRSAVAERRIPYVKVGRLVRFDPVAIDAWVAEQAVPVGGRS